MKGRKGYFLFVNIYEGLDVLFFSVLFSWERVFTDVSFHCDVYFCLETWTIRQNV